MNERDPEPTAEELEAARRLADALESGDFAKTDPESRAVVRLFESLTESGGDDLARRRLRRELVSRVSRRPRRRWIPWAAAAVVAVGAAALGLSLWHHGTAPGERLLAEREAEARAAFSALPSSGGSLDELFQARVETSLQQARFERLAGDGRALADDPSSSPGGPS